MSYLHSLMCIHTKRGQKLVKCVHAKMPITIIPQAFLHREREGERERAWGGREEVREKEGDREGERLRER